MPEDQACEQGSQLQMYFLLKVIDKDADAVLDEVEAAIFLVAQSILSGQGFSYAIPSRAKGNQLYVPEIDRIVLRDSASARPFANTSTCRCAARAKSSYGIESDSKPSLTLLYIPIDIHQLPQLVCTDAIQAV